jgi:hypothetical protein
MKRNARCKVSSGTAVDSSILGCNTMLNSKHTRLMHKKALQPSEMSLTGWARRIFIGEGKGADPEAVSHNSCLTLKIML